MPYGLFEPVKIRFARFVDPNGRKVDKKAAKVWPDIKGDICSSWTGSTDDSGYGYFGIKSSKVVRAHRFAYEQEFGPIPKGIKVCHKCDHPECIRIDHLFLGTDKMNMHDRDKKGRRVSSFGKRNGMYTCNIDFSGCKNPNVKLTSKIVGKIRKKYKTGNYTLQELANRYGVHNTQISRIVCRKSW